MINIGDVYIDRERISIYIGSHFNNSAILEKNNVGFELYLLSTYAFTLDSIHCFIVINNIHTIDTDKKEDIKEYILAQLVPNSNLIVNYDSETLNTMEYYNKKLRLGINKEIEIYLKKLNLLGKFNIFNLYNYEDLLEQKKNYIKNLEKRLGWLLEVEIGDIIEDEYNRSLVYLGLNKDYATYVVIFSLGIQTIRVSIEEAVKYKRTKERKNIVQTYNSLKEVLNLDYYKADLLR